MDQLRDQIRNALEEVKAKLKANPSYQLSPYERSMLQAGLNMAAQIQRRPPRGVKRAARRLGLQFPR